MSIECVGFEREHGRAVFLVTVGHLEELPGHIQLPCSRFGLLLSYDASARDEALWETLGKLVDCGCAYLSTWGPGCEYVHDLMDEWQVMRDLDEPQDRVILTTWHDDEPLGDALDLALMLRPDDYYAEGCDAVVVANVGDAADPNELRSLLRERVSVGH